MVAVRLKQLTVINIAATISANIQQAPVHSAVPAAVTYITAVSVIALLISYSAVWVWVSVQYSDDVQQYCTVHCTVLPVPYCTVLYNRLSGFIPPPQIQIQLPVASSVFGVQQLRSEIETMLLLVVGSSPAPYYNKLVPTLGSPGGSWPWPLAAPLHHINTCSCGALYCNCSGSGSGSGV